MVRISKLTDYALVIMAYIAEISLRQDLAHASSNLRTGSKPVLQAREIAEQTHLSLPTVSKLLKILTKHQFLNSIRGASGGYQLAIGAEKISIADLIQALEGPLAITECNLGHDHCSSETLCAIRGPWLQINQIISDTLSAIKLSDLINRNNENDENNKKTGDPLKSRKHIPNIALVVNSQSNHALANANNLAGVSIASAAVTEGGSHGL